MNDQAERRYVRSEQVFEHLRQIVQVPENVTGATITIRCEAGELARVEWRTLATPAKDSEQ